jgi:hydroxymethylpyrimidine pyrophosphatase-like HAD family hydrolase
MYFNDPDQRYVDRLIRQYKEHKSLVIAVDFDDTIYPGNVNTSDQLSKVLITLRECTALGLKLVIFTARNQKDFPEILNFCDRHKLDVKAINEDIVELVKPTSGKIYYNVLLDDKAGLEQALKILRSALSIIKHLT